MDDVSELEYWQKMAKHLAEKNMQLEEELRACRATNGIRTSNIDDTTQNMVIAKLELLALKSRIQEANNILVSKLKAAHITSLTRKATDDSYSKGLAEGVETTILFVTELYRRAINTKEPLH
jgi:hypothetical protein